MTATLTSLIRAIIYGRFSTIDQEKGDSQRRQIEVATRFCERQGWEVSENLFDKGLSGFHGRNTKGKAQLADFLERVASGKIGKGYALVFENWDRFSRQPFSEVYPRIQALLRKGIVLASISPEIILTKENADDLNIILTFTMPIVLGYAESKKKSERLQAKWAEFRSTKTTRVPGNTPCWLKKEPIPGKREGDIRFRAVYPYQLDPRQAAIVKKVFALALNGKSLRHITHSLNAENAKTLGDCDYWGVATVGKLIRNRATIGEYQPKSNGAPVGPPIPGYFPPVIEEKDFYRLQSMFRGQASKGTKSKNETNLFTGILHHEAGSPGLVGKGGSGSSTLNSRDSYQGKGKKVPSFNYGVFERIFLTWLKELPPSDLLGADNTADLHQAEANLAKIENQLSEIKKRYTANPDATSLLDLLLDLETRKKEALKHLESVRGTSYLSSGEHKDFPTLVDMLNAAKGEKLIALRAKIKSRVQQLVKAVTFAVWKNHTSRLAVFKIVLNSRYTRFIVILTRGRTNSFRIDHWVTEGLKRGDMPSLAPDFVPKVEAAMGPKIWAEIAKGTKAEQFLS